MPGAKRAGPSGKAERSEPRLSLEAVKVPARYRG
jgi:hypothetical protein